MSYYAKYLKYKTKYLEMKGKQLGGGINQVDYTLHVDNTENKKDFNVDRGKLSTQLDNERIWYIKEEDNKGLFNPYNEKYFFIKDASRGIRSRKEDLIVNATYNGQPYKIQIENVYFADPNKKYLIVKGFIRDFTPPKP